MSAGEALLALSIFVGLFPIVTSAVWIAGGLQVLTNRGHAATEPNVLVARRVPRALQRRVDAVGHEVEDGAALHLQRRRA